MEEPMVFSSTGGMKSRKKKVAKSATPSPKTPTVVPLPKLGAQKAPSVKLSALLEDQQERLNELNRNCVGELEEVSFGKKGFGLPSAFMFVRKAMKVAEPPTPPQSQPPVAKEPRRPSIVDNYKRRQKEIRKTSVGSQKSRRSSGNSTKKAAKSGQCTTRKSVTPPVTPRTRERQRRKSKATPPPSPRIRKDSSEKQNVLQASQPKGKSKKIVAFGRCEKGESSKDKYAAKRQQKQVVAHAAIGGSLIVICCMAIKNFRPEKLIRVMVTNKVINTEDLLHQIGKCLNIESQKLAFKEITLLGKNDGVVTSEMKMAIEKALEAAEMTGFNTRTIMENFVSGISFHGTRQKLMEFFKKVDSVWHDKPGDILTELYTNIKTPNDDNPILKYKIFQIILDKLRKKYSEKCNHDFLLLVLFIYSLDGPDLDRVFLFEDAPALGYYATTKAKPGVWKTYCNKYTSSGVRNCNVFSVIGKATRETAEKGDGASVQSKDDLFRWIKTISLLIHCQLTDTPKGEGEIIYRGMHGDSSLVDIFSSYREGEWLGWPCASSCTTDVSCAESFSSKVEFGSSVLFEIRNHGSYVDMTKHSRYPDEEEHLLLPFSMLKIDSIKTDTAVDGTKTTMHFKASSYGLFGESSPWLGTPLTDEERCEMRTDCISDEEEALYRLGNILKSSSGENSALCTVLVPDGVTSINMSPVNGMIPISPNIETVNIINSNKSITPAVKILLEKSASKEWPSWLSDNPQPHPSLDLSSDCRSVSRNRSFERVQSRANIFGSLSIPYSSPKIVWHIAVKGTPHGMEIGICTSKKSENECWYFDLSQIFSGRLCLDKDFITLTYETGVIKSSINGSQREEPIRVNIIKDKDIQLCPYASLRRIGCSVKLITESQMYDMQKIQLVEKEMKQRDAIVSSQVKELYQLAGSIIEESETINRMKILTLYGKAMAISKSEIEISVSKEFITQRIEVTTSEIQFREIISREVLVNNQQMSREMLTQIRISEFKIVANCLQHHWLSHTEETSEKELGFLRDGGLDLKSVSIPQSYTICFWSCYTDLDDIQFLLELRTESECSLTIRSCSNGYGHTTPTGCCFTLTSYKKDGKKKTPAMSAVAPFFFQNDEWVHVAVIVSQASIVFIKNGIIATTTKNTEVMTKRNYSDCIAAGTCENFNDIRIYGRPLSVEDVSFIAEKTDPRIEGQKSNFLVPSAEEMLKKLSPPVLSQ